MTTTITISSIEALEAERQRLAFEVQQGTAQPRDLERIEMAISNLKRDQERAALVSREAAARAEVEAEAAARQRREDLQRALDKALAERPDRAREFDAAMDLLVPVVTALLLNAEAIYKLTAQLNGGNASNRLRLQEITLGALQHRLAGLLGIDRPQRAYRGRLAQILSGATAPAESGEAE